MNYFSDPIDPYILLRSKSEKALRVTGTAVVMPLFVTAGLLQSIYYTSISGFYYSYLGCRALHTKLSKSDKLSKEIKIYKYQIRSKRIRSYKNGNNNYRTKTGSCTRNELFWIWNSRLIYTYGSVTIKK